MQCLCLMIDDAKPVLPLSMHIHLQTLLDYAFILNYMMLNILNIYEILFNTYLMFVPII